MRIVMLGSRGIPARHGGVETAVEFLSIGLVHRGHSVTVIGKTYKSQNNAIFKGVKLVNIPALPFKHLEMISLTFLGILYILWNKKQFDIVHIHSVDPALLSPLLVNFFPIIVTSQGLVHKRKEWSNIGKSFSLFAEKIFLQFPHKCAAVSKTLVRYYRETYNKNVVYIPNAVTPRPQKANPTSLTQFGLTPHKYILYVGRLIPSKGAHSIIDAYKRIATDSVLVFAGDSCYTDAYCQQITQHRSPSIRFLGFQQGEALNALYDYCQMFVFASDHEGLSLVLLEALASGRPVIYSDIPENVEVAHGIGHQFKTGDSIDLSAKMQYILSNPALFEKDNLQAIQRISQQYNWNSVVDGYVDQYHSMVQKSSRKKSFHSAASKTSQVLQKEES